MPMTLNKTKLECPRCHWIFEVTPPDSEHPELSVEIPQKDSIMNDVKEINLICRNKRCNKSFSLRV